MDRASAQAVLTEAGTDIDLDQRVFSELKRLAAHNKEDFPYSSAEELVAAADAAKVRCGALAKSFSNPSFHAHGLFLEHPSMGRGLRTLRPRLRCHPCVQAVQGTKRKAEVRSWLSLGVPGPKSGACHMQPIHYSWQCSTVSSCVSTETR